MDKKNDLPYGFKGELRHLVVADLFSAVFSMLHWSLYFTYGDVVDMSFAIFHTCCLIIGSISDLIYFMVKFRGIDTLKARKEGVVSNVYGLRIPLISSPKIEVQFEGDPTPKRVYGFFNYWDKEIFKPGTKVVCYFYESGKIAMGYEKEEDEA
jgi:hypothetical protein